MTLFIFRGLPGSGKSTNAREMQKRHGGRVVERDAVRFMLFGRYTDCDEKLVTETQNTLIDAGLRMGEHVFVSDMNLRNAYVKRLIEKAWAFDTDYEIVDMTNVDVDVCLVRNENAERTLQGKRVPESVITGNYTKFIKGKPFPLPVYLNGAVREKRRFEPYVRDTSKTDAIIVDIDGTLARMVDRGPFDEHLVHTDELFEYVAKMVEHAALADCHIVFMSGRTDKCEGDTEDWLLKHLPWLANGVWWSLHMRRSVEDRGRPDDDVKHDLFHEHVAPHLNVLYCIDDRNKVVAMWREIGLTVAQVAEGDF